MLRRWIVGLVAPALLVVLAVAAGVATTSPAAAAPPAATRMLDPVTEEDGDRTLVASETDFPSTGGPMTVTGSGFDPAIDVYLAICDADIQPDDTLTACIGGPVPDENTTNAWAEITSDVADKTNAVGFEDDGSFTATLTVETPVGSTVDCLESPCALIARSAGEVDERPADILIPVTFAPPSSTSTDPGVVEPDAVSLPEARVGEQQTIVFSGYAPGEAVTVTVLSDPVDIPGITASPSGVVTISFRITEAMIPGQHVVQAVGTVSNRFGVAYFEVLPPIVTTTTPTTSSPAETPTPTPTTTSETPTPTPTTSAEVATEATETASPTSAVAVVVVAPADSGRNLWWLWVLIALVVVVGAIAGGVTLSRRRAEQLEQEEAEQEQQAEAAAAEPSWRPAGTDPYPTTADPYATGADPYPAGGLLSGPALYSGGQPPEPPTTRLPPPGVADQPTQALPTGGPVPPVEPPPTQAIPGNLHPQDDDTSSWIYDLGNEAEPDDHPDDEPGGPRR